MPELKLNETPVRTARNFNINNIKLKDIKYIVEPESFKSTQIKGLDTSIILEKKSYKSSLKYGLRKRIRRRSRKKSK